MSETPFDDEVYEFSKQLFEDDANDEFINYLNSCKMTNPVREKLAAIYKIHCSNDSVLTTLSDLQIDFKLKELDVELLELKMSLSGWDTLTLIDSDFEAACQLLKSRVSMRLSRSYNGFERICTRSSYSTHNQTERILTEQSPNESRRRVDSI